MFSGQPRSFTVRDQKGINMVDLMMWLVIAALLLAAALQSIGFYQKAALLYQLTSDASSVGQNIMREAAMNDGAISDAAVTSGIGSTAKSSDKTKLTKNYSPDGYFTVTTSHPNVQGIKVVYSSGERDGLVPGVNVLNVTPGSPGFMSVYNTGDSIPGPVVSDTTNRFFKDAANKCLDLWGADTTVGTQIMIYKDCHGGLNQQWKWSGDGQIKPSFATTKCMQFSAESTRRLRLADCSDTAQAQIFRTMAVSGNDFKIFHPESGKCMRDTVNTWDWVTLVECSSDDAKRWSFSTSNN